ncbi:hypothetical protein E2C01_076091 [Portunus trituberculatus]|uniref:Uncharacterized protein n=1 Tax=Portunus trituberculatus TaxID=210409 RepID=A0A5B7IMD1_PORTR|nr:hypothetical protein [Portunus trituberculatus]
MCSTLEFKVRGVRGEIDSTDQFS